MVGHGHLARRAALLLSLLPAALGAQQPCRCAADGEPGGDRGRGPWPWIAGLLGGGLLFGGLAARPPEFVTLAPRPDDALRTAEAPALEPLDLPTPQVPVIPLAAPVPVRAPGPGCVVTAAPRPRVTDRERAWWAGLTRAQQRAVIRRNEARQRAAVCQWLLAPLPEPFRARAMAFVSAEARP
jgi:hypothetical protein